MDILLENHNFTLNEDIIGPALTVAVGIEFVLSLVTNSFVLLFTFIHCKTLKQPSIIFLTNFVFANLLMTLLVMPFTITTASAGEWVFGRTIEQKDGVCQFQGFVFAFGIQLSTLTLAVISIDRFLFIVKPFLHKRLMKTWVAFLVVVSVWILAGLINVPPYFGLGQYAFGQFTATCVQVWVGHRDFLAYFCLIFIIVTVVIIVTTLWTFCFTRNFIKRTHITSPSPTDAHNEQTIVQKHLYTKRMRKVIGIFGLLLIITVLTYVPAIITGITGVAIGSDNIPAPILTVVIISFFVNSVANPVIQVYFRRDMSEFLVHTCQRIMNCCTGWKSQSLGDTSFTSQSAQRATQSSNESWI